ncbi:MAG: hypothetical protein RSF01_09445 [Bacteroidales bacterium]
MSEFDWGEVKLSYERSSAYGKNSFPGHGNERLTDEQRRIKELEKELKDRELDLEILKKAIAFFSRTDK